MYVPTPTPDWVILGTPTVDGRVAVYASTELNQAELQHEADMVTDWEGRHRQVSNRIYLTVELRTYTIVVGDTYEKALRHLFETWNPAADERQPVEIAAPRPELTA